MVCLGLEPGMAEWKAQTNSLSYGGTPGPPPHCKMLFSIAICTCASFGVP